MLSVGIAFATRIVDEAPRLPGCFNSAAAEHPAIPPRARGNGKVSHVRHDRNTASYHELPRREIDLPAWYPPPRGLAKLMAVAWGWGATAG